jgi:hypothetical protein
MRITGLLSTESNGPRSTLQSGIPELTSFSPTGPLSRHPGGSRSICLRVLPEQNVTGGAIPFRKRRSSQCQHAGYRGPLADKTGMRALPRERPTAPRCGCCSTRRNSYRRRAAGSCRIYLRRIARWLSARPLCRVDSDEGGRVHPITPCCRLAAIAPPLLRVSLRRGGRRGRAT